MSELAVIPKLKHLVEELCSVAKKWYSIGLQFDIAPETLDNFDGNDNAKCLRMMLREWGRQEEPTWAAVVKVLRCQSVGEYTLANNLEERYIRRQGRQLQSPASTQPMATSQQQLVPFRPTPDDALNGAVVLRSEEVPDAEVQAEISSLHTEFETLRMDIYKYVRRSQPDLDDFAVFVSCPMPSWKTKRPRSMVDIDLDRISDKNAGFRQIFIVVNQYSNWYNYELVDRIAQSYGNPQLKGRMDAYRSRLTEFESHTSAEKLKNIELARPLSDSASVIARLPHHHSNQFTGSDMRRLTHQYAKEAGVDPAAVRMQMVSEKSPVEIIFLVPISLAPYLMVPSFIVCPLLTSQEPLPEDIHERCVYYMHEEEVFRLMGKRVAPSGLRKSSSSVSQTQDSGAPVFRTMHSSVSISSEASQLSETDGATIDPSTVQIYHDKVLMNGDSAVVCKAQFLSLPCAAKYVHQKLVESSAWQLEAFKGGCKILQGCSHPSIVAFLGIHNDNRLRRPILLMELMDHSLKDCLDMRKVNLPLYQQLDICSDVACGLEYLHAKQIIHGNLTATNVLLKGGRAKISGFMSLQTSSPGSKLSLCPGAPESMPRRSFSIADYDKSIDCFSFGVLAIHIATRELPRPHTQAHPESSEVERYEASLEKMEKDHPLHPLILKCLNDEDNQRPSASHLCKEMSAMTATFDYRNSQSADHIATELVGKQIEYLQDKLSEKTDECKAHKEETELFRDRIIYLEEKIKAATHELDNMTKQRAEDMSEKDQMCKDLWSEKDRTETMHGKIKELEKERDDYKEKFECSSRAYATPYYSQQHLQ